MEGMSGEAKPKALTAAEKRAARRARVLNHGESRIKLLTGEISSLKEEQEASKKAVEQVTSETKQMEEKSRDDQTMGRAACSDDGSSSGAKFPARVDPAQRRRDAAARRKKKEAVVNEILGSSEQKATDGDTDEQDAFKEKLEGISKPVPEVSLQPTSGAKGEQAFTRHTQALRLRSVEEYLILALLFGGAVYLAMNISLKAFVTDISIAKQSQLLASYQQLITQGVPVDSIRQQMERENVDASLVQQVEELLKKQRSLNQGGDESIINTSLLGFVDFPGLFLSLVNQPPVVVWILGLRFAMASAFGLLHQILGLPDVKQPQEDDMGFIINLVLANRPVFKSYLSRLRKSIDDVFFFIFTMIIILAVRCIVEAS